MRRELIKLRQESQQDFEISLVPAKNANEMFRIFSRFNALFVRQRIRGAIKEYQTQLIQRVKVCEALIKIKYFVSVTQLI